MWNAAAHEPASVRPDRELTAGLRPAGDSQSRVPPDRGSPTRRRLTESRSAGPRVSDPQQPGGDAADGVLLALPALLGEGLLSHTRRHCALPPGYHPREFAGTTDYWFNGLGGESFFVLTHTVNPGLVAVLRDQMSPDC